MKTLVLLLAAALPALAVDGVVMNKTTGKPQPGVVVMLMGMGGGTMMPAGSAKSGPDGKFKIDAPAGGMHLLQATYAGVPYTATVAPGAPASGVEIAVYEATTARDAIKTTEHFALLDTDNQMLVINETFLAENSGDKTFTDAAQGTVRFWVPPTVKQADVKFHATAPNSVPVERSLAKGKEKNTYQFNFPLKPGETRFEISYRMAVTTPVVFEARNILPDVPWMLVTRRGFSLEGEDVKLKGQDQSGRFAVYDTLKPVFKATLTGSASAAAPAAEGDGQPAGNEIESIPPRIYWRGRYIAILGLGLAILALGFTLLYRRTS